ncbi:hypothetical protein GQ457_05G022370 [Hibiscus cannabinus]
MWSLLWHAWRWSEALTWSADAWCGQFVNGCQAILGSPVASMMLAASLLADSGGAWLWFPSSVPLWCFFVCAILVRPFVEVYPRIVLPLWLCFCGSFHPFPPGAALASHRGLPCDWWVLCGPCATLGQWHAVWVNFASWLRYCVTLGSWCKVVRREPGTFYVPWWLPHPEVRCQGLLRWLAHAARTDGPGNIDPCPDPVPWCASFRPHIDLCTWWVLRCLSSKSPCRFLMHDLSCTRACHGVLHWPPWLCRGVVGKALASHRGLSRVWWVMLGLCVTHDPRLIVWISLAFWMCFCATMGSWCTVVHCFRSRAALWVLRCLSRKSPYCFLLLSLQGLLVQGFFSSYKSFFFSASRISHCRASSLCRQFLSPLSFFSTFLYYLLYMAESLLAKLGDLNFTAEEQDVVVVFPETVAIPAEDFACSLVGCVLSLGPLDCGRVARLFRTIWKDDKVQTITEINPNFFLIAFASSSDRDNVLKRGPWDFQKQWFALEPADTARTIHDYTFQYMCIWVRIHNIPLSLMTEALARTLGACIGKVVMTDTRLEDGNMGEFLRVRVSLDTTKPLRRCVTLSRSNAKAILCPLQYERVPIFCHGCGFIGHIVLQCPTTPQGDDQKLQYGAWLRAPSLNGRLLLVPVAVSLFRPSPWHPRLPLHPPPPLLSLPLQLRCPPLLPLLGPQPPLPLWPRAAMLQVHMRGTLSDAFLPQRGLRQGDPLSPFLFLFCTEGFSAALTTAQREGRLPGVRARKHGPPVNHLLFADDSLVFLRNDMSEVHCLKDILTTYSTVSGQKVNFSKSTAYFSPRTPPKHRLAVHEALGFQEVSDPGIYLGVHLLIGKNKYAAFGRYRDKMDTRVSKWSNLLLSFSGREVLIKSIAQALSQYVMFCYLLPCSLVEEMSRSIRRFWWSGKGSARGWPFVAWADLCQSKAAGGMGFKDLHLFNIALLVRLFRNRWGGFSPVALSGGSADNEEIPLHVENIVEVPISSDRADTLIWGDHDSGLYTVRSSYLFLQRPSSPFVPPPRLWKILAKIPAISKVRSFGWRCGWDALPVGSRLQDAGFSGGACPLCGARLEDTLHALRDCPDSSLALRQAGFVDSLLSTDQASAVDWLGFATSILSQRSLALLLTLLWGLWRRRNTWTPPTDAAHTAAAPPRWRPPPTGSVKINVDGTFLPSACLGAIGVLARDNSDAVLGGFARPVPVVGPASAVEASALLAGLEDAIARGWASALVESDAAVLVNKLHRPTPDLSLLGGLLAPSRNLVAASRGCIRVGFTPQSTNSATHTLASWACQHNDVISFTLVCPELISRIVLDDLSFSF